MKYIVFLIYLLSTILCEAQNIYILGKPNTSDISKIRSLVSSINSKYRIKGIKFYYNNSQTPFFYYTKKKDFNLENELETIIMSNNNVVNPKLATIENFKYEINNSLNNRIEQIIVDIVGNDDLIAFNKNISDKLTYLKSLGKRSKEISFLIYFYPTKPKITINSPKKGDTITNKHLIIEGITNAPTGSVNVYLNSLENPIKAKLFNKSDKSANWSIDIDLDDNTIINTIYAKAIDVNGEISDLETLTGVFFKHPIIIIENIITKPNNMLAIDYISPINSDVVNKCFNNGNYFYKFQFSTYSQKIIRDSIVLVIEDANKTIIKEILLKSFIKKNGENVINKIVRSDVRSDYCLYILFRDLGFKTECDPVVEDAFYYYFKYSKDYLPTEKILIHFQSFDTKFGAEEYCECN